MQSILKRANLSFTPTIGEVPNHVCSFTKNTQKAFKIPKIVKKSGKTPSSNLRLHGLSKEVYNITIIPICISLITRSKNRSCPSTTCMQTVKFPTRLEFVALRSFNNVDFGVRFVGGAFVGAKNGRECFIMSSAAADIASRKDGYNMFPNVPKVQVCDPVEETGQAATLNIVIQYKRAWQIGCYEKTSAGYINSSLIQHSISYVRRKDLPFMGRWVSLTPRIALEQI